MDPQQLFAMLTDMYSKLDVLKKMDDTLKRSNDKLNRILVKRLRRAWRHYSSYNHSYSKGVFDAPKTLPSKLLQRDLFKISPIIKCYKCEWYVYVAANCPTPIRVSKVREPPVTNPELFPSLQSTSTVIVCSSNQPLPPLLPTLSHFSLWHMLHTKSKFYIDLVSIANYDRSNKFTSSFGSTESTSLFASLVHELYKKISDKVAKNNANHEMQADDRNKLKTFNVGDIVKQLHAYSADPF